MLHNAIVLASEAAEHEAAVNPFVVGGTAAGILLVSLIVLLSFAGGREHS